MHHILDERSLTLAFVGETLKADKHYAKGYDDTSLFKGQKGHEGKDLALKGRPEKGKGLAYEVVAVVWRLIV